MGMIRTPLRFRKLDEQFVVTNEAGDFDLFDNDFPDRYANNELNVDDEKKLEDLSVLFPEDQLWRVAALRNRIKWAQERNGISYLLLIPTLRCDLTCTYCQVSRAPVDSTGYDWDEDTLQKVLRFIGELESSSIKVEFQGGEPTLRIDLIKRVIDFCEASFESCEFVVCSNMTTISDDLRQLLEKDNFSISSSIDGDINTMTLNRTQDDQISSAILNNIKHVQDKYGHEKISALPTVTTSSISAAKNLIDQYVDLGFSGIFLRPVNYLGFARKKHADSHDWNEGWEEFYEACIEHIARINQEIYFEEFSLSVIVKQIFLGSESGFVDHRSPARYASDYILIDYDGTLYPTDESRMLSRVGQIDLNIGNVTTGIDNERVSDINHNALHQDNPDCLHCTYMPYCGVDIIDDLSRYGRIDIAKENTWFCKKQMFLMDLIFRSYANKDRLYMDAFLKWAYQKSSPVGYGGIYD